MVSDFLERDFGDDIDDAMDTKAEQDMLADLEHERMAEASYLRAHPVGPSPADQSLAYEPGDPKGKHALGWTNE